MNMRFPIYLLISLAIIAGCSAQNGENDNVQSHNNEPRPEELQPINLPEGFRIGIYAEDVEGARSMALAEDGTLFIGTRSEGKVYAVRDEDNDHKADKKYVLASGLNMPNGVALRDGDLYVAEISRILRFQDILNHLDNPPQPVTVRDDFPTDRHHGWKYIAFGPKGQLYVPVGAPCNICEPNAPYATIMRMDQDGSNLEVFASGIRNSVGFTWHPQTGDMWFTDNGRDHLGDNKPPDELNRAPREGLHFGYPYCHGGHIADPEFGSSASCSDYQAPEQNLGPHVAALGLEFYTGNMFPEKYQGDIFIAEHGSWNRSVPVGYRIMHVKIDNDKASSYEIFADGWLLDNENRIGRPVDLELMPDGSLLVSDDYSGRIYRISY